VYSGDDTQSNSGGTGKARRGGFSSTSQQQKRADNFKVGDAEKRKDGWPKVKML
jgi:hypothetical protein